MDDGRAVRVRFVEEQGGTWVHEEFDADGGYAGVAIGVDINRHFNITLGYTGFVYADEYYDSDCDDDYRYDCDFSRADTVTLGVEARF